VKVLLVSAIEQNPDSPRTREAWKQACSCAKQAGKLAFIPKMEKKRKFRKKRTKASLLTAAQKEATRRKIKRMYSHPKIRAEMYAKYGVED